MPIVKEIAQSDCRSMRHGNWCVGVILVCLLAFGCKRSTKEDSHGDRPTAADLQEVDSVNRFVKEGRWDRAAEVCTTLLSHNIDNRARVSILHKRGDMYRLLNKPELALADADAAAALTTTDEGPFRLRHAVLLKLARYQEVISNDTRAIELWPHKWDWYFSRGKAYGQFGYYAEAIDDCASAIRLNASAAEIYDYQAQMALPAGRYEIVEQACIAAIDLSGAGEMASRYYTLGMAQYNLGDQNGARASFERVAAVKAKNESEKLAMIGSVYANLCDYRTAFTFYDRAVASDSTNVTIITDRGLMHFYAGDFGDAGRDLEKVLQLDKPGFYQYSLRALVRLSNGQYERSIEDNENMVRLRPELVDGYLVQGINYLLIGQRPKAMEVFNTGLHQTTAEEDIARLSIWYTLAGGKIDENTRKVLMQFSEQQWPNPLVRYYFGSPDEQGVLKLAKRRDPALSNQQENEARFYIGARLMSSDMPHARELLEKAANSKPPCGIESVIAHKELEHDFLR